MKRNKIEMAIDDRAYELLLAEEELILHAQMLIQRVLNEQGISQKKLAEKLGVGESYVSQMLGTSARNLTLRTIARVMKALGAKATLTLDDHFDAMLEEPVEDDAKAVVSRMAAASFSEVWGDLIELEPRKNAGRRRGGDAHAYASYDPPLQEMALAA